jgi:hypothetical protein
MDIFLSVPKDTQWVANFQCRHINDTRPECFGCTRGYRCRPQGGHENQNIFISQFYPLETDINTDKNKDIIQLWSTPPDSDEFKIILGQLPANHENITLSSQQSLWTITGWTQVEVLPSLLDIYNYYKSNYDAFYRDILSHGDLSTPEEWLLNEPCPDRTVYLLCQANYPELPECGFPSLVRTAPNMYTINSNQDRPLPFLKAELMIGDDGKVRLIEVEPYD